MSTKNTKRHKGKSSLYQNQRFSHKEFIKGKSAKIRSLSVLRDLRGLFHAFVTPVRN